MAAPEFTFDPSRDPPLTEIRALYQRILGPVPGRPTVSLGQVTRAKAMAWLDAQQTSYRESVGKRSHLVANLVLADLVELVGLTEP